MSDEDRVVLEEHQAQYSSSMRLGELLSQVADETERFGANRCTITFDVPTARGVLVVQAEFQILQRPARLN